MKINLLEAFLNLLDERTLRQFVTTKNGLREFIDSAPPQFKTALCMTLNSEQLSNKLNILNSKLHIAGARINNKLLLACVKKKTIKSLIDYIVDAINTSFVCGPDASEDQIQANINHIKNLLGGLND